MTVRQPFHHDTSRKPPPLPSYLFNSLASCSHSCCVLISQNSCFLSRRRRSGRAQGAVNQSPLSRVLPFCSCPQGPVRRQSRVCVEHVLWDPRHEARAAGCSQTRVVGKTENGFFPFICPLTLTFSVIGVVGAQPSAETLVSLPRHNPGLM